MTDYPPVPHSDYYAPGMLGVVQRCTAQLRVACEERDELKRIVAEQDRAIRKAQAHQYVTELALCWERNDESRPEGRLSRDG